MLMHCRSPLDISLSYLHLNDGFLEPELPVSVEAHPVYWKNRNRGSSIRKWVTVKEIDIYNFLCSDFSLCILIAIVVNINSFDIVTIYDINVTLEYCFARRGRHVFPTVY